MSKIWRHIDQDEVPWWLLTHRDSMVEQDSYQRLRQESRQIQIETLVEDGIKLTAESQSGTEAAGD